jgi:hypothetical protein
MRAFLYKFEAICLKVLYHFHDLIKFFQVIRVARERANCHQVVTLLS